jgi:hypothetical protein
MPLSSIQCAYMHVACRRQACQDHADRSHNVPISSHAPFLHTSLAILATTLHAYIPVCVGAQKGDNIKRLRLESQAEVSMEDQVLGSEERVVTITMHRCVGRGEKRAHAPAMLLDGKVPVCL